MQVADNLSARCGTGVDWWDMESIRIYDDHYSRQYGFLRSYLEKVIYRYRDCGDLHNGFVCLKCKDCGHEYLLAFPRKYHCFQLVIFNAYLASILRTCR